MEFREVPRNPTSRDLQKRVPPQPKITLKEAVQRDLFLTYREAAAYWRCTPSQVAAWARRGLIDMYEQPGGRRVVRARDVYAAMKDGLIAAGEDAA
jgi:hypothetical protein